jgi:hypothetical protein
MILMLSRPPGPNDVLSPEYRLEYSEIPKGAQGHTQESTGSIAEKVLARDRATSPWRVPPGRIRARLHTQEDFSVSSGSAYPLAGIRSWCHRTLSLPNGELPDVARLFIQAEGRNTGV